MANPLRKTMVYLGLADEEFDYEEETPVAPVGPRRPRAAVAGPRAGHAAASSGRQGEQCQAT